MTTFVKICGLRTREAVETAVVAGADALGFVFAESPRRITPEEASAVTRGLPARIVRVAVMQHPEPADWAEVARVFQPDWLQADAGDFAVLELAPEVRRIPVYRDTADLDVAALRAEDLVIFEAAASGQGMKADWHRARELAAQCPMILAGGLDPINVADAIETVRPWGVDVSSGVERVRGEKDLMRIAAFVSAVRTAEQTNAD